MESSTIIVFLCLSAACLVSCQIPDCPEDVLNNRSKYYKHSYLPDSDTVLKQCYYYIRTGYLGYYFGPPRTIRRTYYDCAEGLTHLLISDVGTTPLYTCEEDAEVVPDEAGSGAPTDTEITGAPIDNIETTGAPTGTTGAPTTTTGAPTGTTQRPTTAAPTTSSGLMDCPRGGFQTNNYVYSSLTLIEPVQCIVRASVYGAPMNRISTVYMCKDGFKREQARGRQWRCVAA